MYTMYRTPSRRRHLARRATRRSATDRPDARFLRDSSIQASVREERRQRVVVNPHSSYGERRSSPRPSSSASRTCSNGAEITTAPFTCPALMPLPDASLATYICVAFS